MRLATHDGEAYLRWARQTLYFAHEVAGESPSVAELNDLIRRLMNEAVPRGGQYTDRELLAVTKRILQYCGELVNYGD